jgi:hypothetical protein
MVGAHGEQLDMVNGELGNFGSGEACERASSTNTGATLVGDRGQGVTAIPAIH